MILCDECHDPTNHGVTPVQTETRDEFVRRASEHFTQRRISRGVCQACGANTYTIDCQIPGCMPPPPTREVTQP